MADEVHSGPTIATQALRALRRYPDRHAFVSGNSSFSYRAALELIARMQAVFLEAGLKRGQRLGLLSANRAEAWCAGIAASASGLSTTWLHPLGSLADQVDQLEDGECAALLVDAATFLERGGELAARACGLASVYTLGPAEYGLDLLRAAEAIGSATARDLASSDRIAVLNYTGGTTGKSKGAIRTHAQIAAYTTSILADFE